MRDSTAPSNPQSEENWQVTLRALSGLGIAGAVTAGVLLIMPASAYFWVKALHIIAIISWMAGMLYLPRLFVYHCECAAGSAQSETFKIMERRLLRAIINPAMVASWGFGLWLAWHGNFFTHGWFVAKLGLVIALSAVHGLMSRWVRDFAQDRNTRPQRFFRFANEVPTLLMIGIVILVTVKPF